MSVLVELSSEESDYMFMTASWSFEEDEDEICGYIDFSIDRESKKLEDNGIGYY